MSTILSGAARELLEASLDPTGLIIRLSAMGSAYLRTNRRMLGGPPAELERWEGVIQELLRLGLIESHGAKVYSVTLRATGPLTPRGASTKLTNFSVGAFVTRRAAMKRLPVSRILVIDDDPRLVDLVANCLREEGYRVSSALTSDEGLKLVVMSRPDLILLDLMLPGVNGIDMLKRIRAINLTNRVIMVTGNTDPLLARESLEFGALAYIDKPFDFDCLKRVVAMALQAQTQQPDNYSQT
jgi:CheY-like chemotaxis protein